jgi:uncharacterized protein YjiS (DUF1127 family)
MFAALKNRLCAWLTYRRTCSELYALNRRELDDIGIAPWQIREIARRSVYGR